MPLIRPAKYTHYLFKTWTHLRSFFRIWKSRCANWIKFFAWLVRRQNLLVVKDENYVMCPNNEEEDIDKSPSLVFRNWGTTSRLMLSTSLIKVGSTYWIWAQMVEMIIMTIKQVLNHGAKMESKPEEKCICIWVLLSTTTIKIECTVRTSIKRELYCFYSGLSVIRWELTMHVH
jgi:hypothetical protein